MKMLHSILVALHLSKDEKPLDKLQMEAAKDRLKDRGDELEEQVDELTKMVRRMKRRGEH